MCENNKDFAAAGDQSQKDVARIYDEKHGKYDNRAVRDDKVTKPPPSQPSPIAFGK